MVESHFRYWLTLFAWILFIVFSIVSSLCCTCGVPIPPNPANMCVACLRTQVDISEGIPKQVTVHFCKQCERFVPWHFFSTLNWAYKSTTPNYNIALSTFSLQVLAASSHMDAVCAGVQRAAHPLSEKD